MAQTSPTPVLGDDHIDLLVSAAASWHILGSRTRVAFSQSALESHVLVATMTEAGRLVRAENACAVRWLSDHGRTRLVDRVDVGPYAHHRVERLDPVEVIKAAQSAQAACSASPTWQGSAAQRLLAAVLTAATHRLKGYGDAPWCWTRPKRRGGHPIGVAIDAHLEVPGLEWVTPDELRQHWTSAPIVLVTTAAVAAVPADLPARPGVFLLVIDEHPNKVWQLLTALHMPALVLFWPTCREWLLGQLADPAPEFVEHRSQA